MSTDLLPKSRLELIVDNLEATFAEIDGVVGVTSEEPAEDGPGSYQQTELPHVWFFEQGETPLKWENNRRRYRQSFVAVLIFDAEEPRQVRRTGRRFMALMQTELVKDTTRGVDANTLTHAQDTYESGSAIGTLPEKGKGVCRIDFDVEYVRGVKSAFVRGDEA